VRSLSNDLIAGLFMIGLGLMFVYFGFDYTIGTPAEMGPGFMPMLLAIGLVALGAIKAAPSLAISGRAMEPWEWQPLLVILLSVLVFAVTIETSGLFAAAFLAVFVGRLADIDGQRGDAILLAGLIVGLLVLAALFNSRAPISSAKMFGWLAVSALVAGLSIRMLWIRLSLMSGRQIVETVLLAIGLALGSVLVFINGLGLSMKAWPWG
jgi:hypothetical protein